MLFVRTIEAFPLGVPVGLGRTNLKPRLDWRGSCFAPECCLRALGSTRWCVLLRQLARTSELTIWSFAQFLKTCLRRQQPIDMEELKARSLARPGPPWMDQVQRPDFSSEPKCWPTSARGQSPCRALQRVSDDGLWQSLSSEPFAGWHQVSVSSTLKFERQRSFSLSVP
jgi:hypothetical protein